VFDHSASVAEHLNNFLAAANRGICWRFLANFALFGISLPNAAPTGMQAAWHHRRDG
jgi:hypothetical protein